MLRDVSLDVHAGELIAVWGQRGAGKTTLAAIAAGLEKPDRGEVSFDGSDLSKSRLPAGIGWLQRMGPHSGDFRTVLDYVALPLLGACSLRRARRHASTMLRRFGVADCAEARWEHLTDGERTLVALAHALVREPRLLVADDPTANLSLLQREEIMRLLRRATVEEGLGILIMVPDMPDVAHADRVASLSDGGLVMSGPAPSDGGTVVDFPGKRQSA